jgi:hypothetical protein
MSTGAEECSDGDTAVAGPLFFLNDENLTRLDASHRIHQVGRVSFATVFGIYWRPAKLTSKRP